jgi:hypothetical protein
MSFRGNLRHFSGSGVAGYPSREPSMEVCNKGNNVSQIRRITADKMPQIYNVLKYIYIKCLCKSYKGESVNLIGISLLLGNISGMVIKAIKTLHLERILETVKPLENPTRCVRRSTN